MLQRCLRSLRLVVAAASGLALGAALSARAEPYDPQRRFPVEQLQQDLTLVREALEEAHPGLTWYTPEVELQAAFAAAAEQIRAPMSERAFHDLLAPVVALVRDGHTGLEVSQGLEVWDGSRPWPTLPFALSIEGEKLYVVDNRSNDPSIQPGDELVEINGLAVQHLIRSARARISADGYGETWRDFHLGFGSLKQVAARTFGIAEPFVLTLVRRDGQRVSKTVTRRKPPDGGPPPDPPRKPAHSFRLLDGKSALFAINGFGYDDYRAVHRRIFEELAGKKVEHLVIDLRENGGGNGDIAVDVMRYLIDRPFQLLADSWTKLRHPDRPSFVAHLDPQVAKQLRENNRYRRSQGGRHHFDNDALGWHQPSSRHPYRGAVYLLTSGRTFSSASLFAASLSGQRKVTVIGQETGGGQAGFCAGINQRLTLPNTKLRLRLPLFRLLSAHPGPNRGRGLMPDHPIVYRWPERLAGKDLELAKALELIGGGRPAP